MYRKDFYRPENMVGYTTDLRMRISSIYFFDVSQSAFGHITYYHDVRDNIGREPYTIDKDYLLFNSKEPNPIMSSSFILGRPPITMSTEYHEQIVTDCKATEANYLVECFGSAIQHISTAPFMNLRYAPCSVQFVLFNMIDNEPYLKRKYWHLENLERNYTGITTPIDDQFKRQHWDKYYR